MIQRMGLVSLLVLASLSRCPGQEPDHIAVLVQQIGSERFADRDRAMSELSGLGATALPALRQASKNRDFEIARRAADLVTHIEERILIAQILAPKKLRLQVDNVSVVEAVRKLADISNYPIQIDGDRTKLNLRKISLDTDEVSFFEALNQICLKGGVSEVIPNVTSVTRNLGTINNINVVRLNRGIQVQPAPQTQPILLRDGASSTLVCNSGAARLTLERIPLPGAEPGTITLQLNASVEPRIEGFNVASVILDKAIDEQGQSLSCLSDLNDLGIYLPTQMLARRSLPLALKPGEKFSRKLRELTGNLTANVILANETIATLELGATPVGKKADLRAGGSIIIQKLDKIANGDYRLEIGFESNLAGNPLAIGGVAVQGNIVVQGNMIFQAGNVNVSSSIPDLLDHKGRKLQRVQMPSQSVRIVNNQITRSLVIIYRPVEEGGAPARLAVFGYRPVTIAIPFRFENVTLN